jgi:hypothetical protein
MMRLNNKSNCCPICGHVQTMDAQFPGTSCIDPAHWQAAGLLSPHDYYPMARMMARASGKPELQPSHPYLAHPK